MSNRQLKVSYGSSTVAKGLDILDLLGEVQRPMTASEMAKALDVNVSSIYRLLSTLVRYDFLSHERETSTFFLGPKLLSLASVVLQRLDIRQASRPILEQLTAQTGEATHLMMLDGMEGVYIERVESLRAIKMASTVGRRELLHASGVGKAILAFLPPDQIDKIIVETGLPRLTSKTITDPQTLRDELAAIRERGYAIDDEESEEGVRCVGAPIVDHVGSVRYSISIAGPAYRLSIDQLNAFAPDLLAGAAHISHLLGASPDHVHGAGKK